MSGIWESDEAIDQLADIHLGEDEERQESIRQAYLLTCQVTDPEARAALQAILDLITN